MSRRTLAREVSELAIHVEQVSMKRRSVFGGQDFGNRQQRDIKINLNIINNTSYSEKNLL
jgi:hypothetical protein